MNHAANKVVVVDGLENDLDVSLQKPRLGEEFRFLCKRLGSARVRLAFRIQFEAGALWEAAKK